MDPVSLTTAAITFAAVLKKAIKITQNASNLAKTLEQQSQEYSHISHELAFSETLLQGLHSLRQDVIQHDDGIHGKLNIPMDTLLRQHVENTKALDTSLQQQKLKSQKRTKRWTSLVRFIITTDTIHPDLSNKLEQFRQSRSLISVQLDALTL